MLPEKTIVSSGTPSNQGHAYVDWAAIIAGIVLASAISVVLIAFGSAIGLSFAKTSSGETLSLAAIVAAVSYVLWVQVSSFMAGAYLTGRMRHRFNDATEHEVDVRDGAHGLIVWAGAVLLGAYLAASGLGAALNTAGNIAKDASQIAAANPTVYYTDMLLRSDANPPSQERSDEVGRILAKTITGKISKTDQDYLALVVAKQAGLSPADATSRVADIITQTDAAKAEAVKVAERARKISVLAAFIAAATLLVSAAAAYWAAGMGGNHRDEGVVLDRWFSRRRPSASQQPR